MKQVASSENEGRRSTEPDGQTQRPTELSERRIVNLGSGHRPVEGAINLDISPATRPDVVHDLDRLPWPFPDASFDEVLGYDVLEHVGSVVGFMEEVHRISRRGAKVRLTVPHFSCANTWRDPTHRHGFAQATLDCFVEGHPLVHYSSARFRRIRAELIFHPSLLNRAVARLANRWPEKYEDRWCWAFPAWFLYFELEAIKHGPA